MKNGEPKDCLLLFFLSMIFSLFVGYGFVSLGGCEMNLCGKIFATIMLVGLIVLLWCCGYCCKEEKDSTNCTEIKPFSFSIECDGKTYKVNVTNIQIVPEENSKGKIGDGK